ncbi:MAG: rRNA maturation protein [Candidatus Methanomethylicota archaeon]|uniref:Probable Brix domain-containing ribosomal biogenesis protein n=1 Tax=Thermoproteota archaeon TaxID=2056631 RepID=A0A497EJQ3_9CREN|nr:MAG: rRNA maturation protein [Candidatus Verstraetearchaeota archaeon]
MLLTTSRKPSRKTRSLAKALARYLNWRYVNRGKMSLEDVFLLDKHVAIIEEVKGNPAVLKLYRDGKQHFMLRFNASNIKKVKMDDSPPVFVGNPPFDPLLFGAIPHSKAGLKLMRKVEFPKEIVVKDGRLYFYYKDELVFSLKVLKLQTI